MHRWEHQCQHSLASTADSSLVQVLKLEPAPVLTPKQVDIQMETWACNHNARESLRAMQALSGPLQPAAPGSMEAMMQKMLMMQMQSDIMMAMQRQSMQMMEWMTED